MKRVCIYPKDIQAITGIGERQARNIVRQIKKLHNKEKHQPITINEFCNFMGLDNREIEPMIK